MTAIEAILAVVWQPCGSPLHILAGAVVLGVVAAVAYARTFRGNPWASSLLLLMRLMVIVVLALLLLGPSELPPAATDEAKPRLTVLVDTSASMLTPDCEGLSRIGYARGGWLAPQQLRTLALAYDLRLMGFDDTVRPLTADELARSDVELAAGRSTRLAQAVGRILADEHSGGAGLGDGSAVLVLSDGHDSTEDAISAPAQLARGQGLPIHTACFGQPSLQRDVAVAAAPTQEFLLMKEPGQVLAHVYQVGFDQASATVRLRAGTGELARQNVDFGGGPSATVRFPVQQDQPGQYEYVVAVDPLAGEAERVNNQQSVFIEVTGRRIRVLLIEGQPYWDTKFLAQSLRKDERIELVQITQMSLRKRERIVTRVEGPSVELPRTLEGLGQFDVVLLGSGLENVLDAEAAQLLPRYVAQAGGQVVFVRGRGYDEQNAVGRAIGRELAGIEPVIWGRGVLHHLALAPTAAGRDTPPFAFRRTPDMDRAVARLPGFTVMAAVEREKAGALVLARALPVGAAASGATQTGAPALVKMTYGRGTVVAVLGEGLWQWSMLPRDLRQYDGFYDSFWSNLVRWLALGADFQPGQDVALKVSRSSLALGESVPVDVVCKFDPPSGGKLVLTLTAPDGRRQELPLRRLPGREPRYQAAVLPNTPGVWGLDLDSPGLTPPTQARRFAAYDVNIERLQCSAQPATMRLLAEQSGGRAFAPGDFAQLPGHLARQRLALTVPRQPVFLWDRGWILGALLAWMGLEWLARRKAGLL